jgi:hypothetical protein
MTPSKDFINLKLELKNSKHALKSIVKNLTVLERDKLKKMLN